MTGKAVSFPGLEARSEEKEVSEHIQEMLKAQAVFLEHEYKRKIDEASNKSVPKYMDEVFQEGEKVLYQEKDKKKWIHGTVVNSRSNEIEIEADNVIRRVHPNRVQRFYPDLENEDGCETDSSRDVIEEIPGQPTRPVTRSMSRVNFDDNINASYIANDESEDVENLESKNHRQKQCFE